MARSFAGKSSALLPSGFCGPLVSNAVGCIACKDGQLRYRNGVRKQKNKSLKSTAMIPAKKTELHLAFYYFLNELFKLIIQKSLSNFPIEMITKFYTKKITSGSNGKKLTMPHTQLHSGQ